MSSNPPQPWQGRSRRGRSPFLSPPGSTGRTPGAETPRGRLLRILLDSAEEVRGLGTEAEVGAAAAPMGAQGLRAEARA